MAAQAQDNHAASPTAQAPQRQPLYFPSGERRLFGCYHPAAPERARNCAVVICNPLGYEYTHSHRALRHLAEALAASGMASLRFDYEATGDSPGDDLAPDRLRAWLQDIRAAIQAARELSRCSEICLLGVRMGAALAAMVASTDDVAQLVLWSPCSGRHYVREMKAVARTAAGASELESGFESGGFTLLHETAEQLGSIDLLRLKFRADCAVLLLQRDDIETDAALEQHLRASGIDVTQRVAPGYADMMAEPQFTAVPGEAIRQIIDWLARRPAPPLPSAPATLPPGTDTTTTRQDGVELIEQCFQFGEHRHLFGIATAASQRGGDETTPTVVLLNSGSVHRVGPNRLYVALARRLAARGFRCFRFDLQGLGDSLLLDGGRENHPYPESACRDTASALQFLQTRFGCSSFILAGLCSGAHNAFHGALALAQYDIVDAILINPLTYHYVEGMSLVTAQHYQDVAHYRKSARNLRSWLKLLRGKVDLTYLAGVALAQAKVKLASLVQSLRERCLPHTAPQLAQDLRRLRGAQRPLSLFIANSDPGYALLMADARYTASQYLKQGFIRLTFIANSDHTFSRRQPRSELIDRICEHLGTRFGPR